MPAFRLAFATRRISVLVPALAALSFATAPAFAAEPPAPKVENSSLDAPLFYQLLLSEIELRDGQAGTAYQLMLDAARRAKDEQLFRRATEMALQARAGDQALSAVLAWRQALPESADALRQMPPAARIRHSATAHGSSSGFHENFGRCSCACCETCASK